MNLHLVSVVNTIKINNIGKATEIKKFHSVRKFKLQEQKLDGYIPGKFVLFVCKL
jgi:hypothetical protein